ncbi:MAG TPA: hypothetical protein VNQ73_07520 [Ilumatobacter sp.]|nr:hypothetical protein [Ilumatobacter sp.]
MNLELSPDAPEDAPAGPSAMRTQRFGRVVAVLDGDAHLRVWEPNRSDNRLDLDLTKALAVVVDAGIGAPPAPRPHWTDPPGTATVLVSLNAGASGAIMIDGHRVSGDAAIELAERRPRVATATSSTDQNGR